MQEHVPHWCRTRYFKGITSDPLTKWKAAD